MPVYVYRRSDGSTFEFEQRITAEPLTSCPISAQRVERVLQPFSARYTRTGFYLTDPGRARGHASPPVPPHRHYDLRRPRYTGRRPPSPLHVIPDPGRWL